MSYVYRRPYQRPRSVRVFPFPAIGPQTVELTGIASAEAFGALTFSQVPANEVEDSFTDSDSTNLTSHVGEIGATWTQHPNGTASPVITSNRIRANSGGIGWAYASGVPASADYAVEGRFRLVSSVAANVGILARLSTTADTYYVLRYDMAAGQWQLRKVVGGTPASLGTFTESLSPGDERTARIVVSGTSIKGYVDGVEQISATDSDITAAGRAGVRFTAFDGTAAGIHIDYLFSYPVTAGDQNVNLTGIASEEAFGTPSFSMGNVDVNLTGIPTAETFGTPTFQLGNVDVSLTGIATQEAFGTPTFSMGGVSVNLTGIASAETFGAPTIQVGGVNVSLTGIASAEAFGTPTIQTGNVDVNLTGIASAESFGTPTFTFGNVNVNLTGIPSEEAFGAITTDQGGAQNVNLTGIPSSEAFGSLTIETGNVDVSLSGIPSAEAFGTPAFQFGNVNVSLTGISSAEEFGTPSFIFGGVSVNLTGIPTGEAFGSLTIETAVDVNLTAIPSEEAFGTVTINVGGVSITLTGIPSEEAFGVLTFLGGTIVPVPDERLYEVLPEDRTFIAAQENRFYLVSSENRNADG